MNPTVRDFMNPRIVYLTEGTRPEIARRFILQFGISAVPVIDDDGKPVGLVSLRDVADPLVKETRASEPALVVGDNERLEAAAHTLAEAGVHQLVAVDGQGRAVGVISALDVLRGLMGLAPKHPQVIETFEGHSAKAQ
jgi:CBS domain-containing protein